MPDQRRAGPLLRYRCCCAAMSREMPMSDDLLAGLRASLAPHNGHARDPEIVAKRFGLGKGPSPRQWEKIQAAIDAWRARVLAGARHMPRNAYQQGHGQVTRFLRLLG